MKNRFVFVTLLIAVVVLTQIPFSLVRAEDTGLPPISGSDCDPTTFEYAGHTMAEGFAVSISADMPFDTITNIKFGGAVAGLGDPWDDAFGFENVPYVKEMRLKVEGDPPYTAIEDTIYDNTGTGGPSWETFSVVLNAIGYIFTAYDIYDWLAKVYQEPPVTEWQHNGHWSEAIVRQNTEPGWPPGTPYVNPDNPRLQTGSANVWGYFYSGESYDLSVTAEAEIYLQSMDLGTGWVYHFYVGTYSVSFEVSVNNPPNTPSTPSGPTTVYRNVWYTYSTCATDPDEDSIRYHLNVTGPGNPYQNTTIWVDSDTPMSWNLLWEPTDSPGTYLIQTWVEDVHGALSPMSSLSVNMYPTYLFDGDFLEGWSCSGGQLWTNGDVGILMIHSGHSSAVMTKSWTFNSEVLEFATVSCTCLPIDSWRFEARRASDETWLYGPNSTSAETKTWAITEWYTGEIDKVGIRIFGDSGPGVSFDYITITNNVTLTITTGFGGTTDPAPGTHEYFEKKSVQVTAIPDPDYYFMYWRLDGQLIHGNPITVTTDSDHTLRASFSSGGGCPTLFVWNGSDYVDYGVINIHDVENDVVREVHVQAEDVSIAGYKVKFRLREGWEGLNYSHSLIDQVKLYAVDSEGNRYLCPLIKAKHIEQGRVLLNLLFSDDYRIDTYLMDTIDLTFKVPYPAGTIENFTFIIEGHNPLKQ